MESAESVCFICMKNAVQPVWLLKEEGDKSTDNVYCKECWEQYLHVQCGLCPYQNIFIPSSADVINFIQTSDAVISLDQYLDSLNIQKPAVPQIQPEEESKEIDTAQIQLEEESKESTTSQIQPKEELKGSGP